MTKENNISENKQAMRPGVPASAKTVAKELVIDIKAGGDFPNVARTRLIEAEWQYPACRLPWHYFERFSSGRAVRQPSVSGLSLEIIRG